MTQSKWTYFRCNVCLSLFSGSFLIYSKFLILSFLWIGSREEKNFIYSLKISEIFFSNILFKWDILDGRYLDVSLISKPIKWETITMNILLRSRCVGLTENLIHHVPRPLKNLPNTSRDFGETFSRISPYLFEFATCEAYSNRTLHS